MFERLNYLFDRTTRRWEPVVTGTGTLFAVLVIVSLWSAVVAAGSRFLFQFLSGPSTLVLLSGATSLLGLAFGAFVYARYRGFDLGIGVLPRPTIHTAGATLAPILLVVSTAAAANALGFTLSATVQQRISPDIGLWRLLTLSLLPGVLPAIGYGFLFCGVVCESLREFFGHDRTVAVATALVGFFWLLPFDAVDTIGFNLASVLEVGLSLLFGVAFGTSLGLAAQRADATIQDFDHREWTVIAIAVVGVLGVGTELLELPRVLGDVLWIAGLAIGIDGYGRTRSVWVSCLSVAVFALTIRVTVYVEAILGVAAPP